MEFKELPKEKVEIINSITSGVPNKVLEYPWLSVYPFEPSLLLDNQTLLNKTVATGITASGAITLGLPIPVYSLDVVRLDGNQFDTDRHLLSTSGSTILKRKEIHKSFPEHHSLNIPSHYLN